MRNRWGVEIKKGHWVSGRTSRGDAVQGRVAKIERTGDYARAYGPRVILDTGESLGVDDIAQTLGPMTVGRGGIVKQNPAVEVRELMIWARDNLNFNQIASTRGPVAAGKYAAAAYSAEHGNGRNAWGEIFSNEDVRIAGQMIHDEADETASPNPLTRVRVKSPPQRPAGNTSAPSKRLIARRKKTAKAAPGVYANPARKEPTPHIALWRWRIQERASESAAWRNVSAIHYKQGVDSAKRAAEDWAVRYPKMFVRLMDDWE